MVSCIKPHTQAPPQQKRRSLGMRLVVLKQTVGVQHSFSRLWVPDPQDTGLLLIVSHHRKVTLTIIWSSQYVHIHRNLEVFKICK